MSEIFFQQLTRKQWRQVEGFISLNLLHTSTDAQTHESLVEFINLVLQFCGDEDDDDLEE